MALSDMQKLFIEKNRDNSITSLIKETGATKKAIEAFIKTLPVPEVPKAPKPMTADDFIHRHNKDGKKVDGIAIMNEAASEWGDKFTKSRSTKPKTPRAGGCIAPSRRND